MRYPLIAIALSIALTAGCGQNQETVKEASVGTTLSEDVENISGDAVTAAGSTSETEAQGQEGAAEPGEVQGTGSLEEADREELMRLADLFYYNFYFHPQGDGTVAEQDRILFALSYIAQYEYQELKKDTTTFVVHITEEHVDHVVERFFGTSVGSHGLAVPETPEGEEAPLWAGIEHDGKSYVVPMQKSTWDSECRLVLERADQGEDGKIAIEFSVQKDSEVLERYQAVFEQKASLFALTKYAALDVEGQEAGTDEQ